MATENIPIIRFNAGRLSPRALARQDLKRYIFGAETMTNWMPSSLGSMMLRPGLKYIGSTRSNALARHIQFIKSNSDTAIIELTDGAMRVRVNEAIITRNSVSTTITNGTFDSDISGWADADESGATSAWASGQMGLTGTNYARAIRTQTVSVSAPDQNVEHGLKLQITQGTVILRVGSSSGGDELINETRLYIGTHSLAFTPTGANVYIQLAADTKYGSYITEISIESAGDMVIGTSWTESDLKNVRYDQSGDVIYLACRGQVQRKIERRSTRSWSLVYFSPEDGPFRTQNITSTTITPSGLSGDVTLTSSRSIFKPSHVGSIIRLSSIGQTVTESLSGAGQETSSIRITGVGTGRVFNYSITGTWTATVTLQRSFDDGATWTDHSNFVANSTSTINDGLDNQIILYRFAIKTGNYTSGTADISMSYPNGSKDGVVYIYSYSSATSVGGLVYRTLGSLTATSDWAEGSWSTLRGWPTAVRFFQGRLWWAGKDKIIGSVSDAYESYDDTIEGDSGVINRSIGEGPVDDINWLLRLQRLGLGGEGGEHFVYSSSLDEPVTPTNFNIYSPTNQGSASVDCVKLDNSGVYVQKSGQRLFQIGYDTSLQQYGGDELTKYVPEIGQPSITQLAIQRQPDTRVHAKRSDGTVGLLIYNKFEELLCWVDITSPGANGEIEDIVVMPGDEEDAVYFTVKRTINGSTVRHFCKWAMESECQGGTVNKQADSFVEFTNSPASSTIAVGTHLRGEDVVVWADGICLKDEDGEIATFTVDASGNISVTNEGEAYLATTGISGLAYQAQFKSMKMGLAHALGTPLNQKKKIGHLALLLYNTHAQGLKYGPDFDHLEPMPLIENETTVDQDSIWEQYDQDAFEFPGEYTTDARICLEANAPRPCTILGMTVTNQTAEKR